MLFGELFNIGKFLGIWNFWILLIIMIVKFVVMVVNILRIKDLFLYFVDSILSNLFCGCCFFFLIVIKINFYLFFLWSVCLLYFG